MEMALTNGALCVWLALVYFAMSCKQKSSIAFSKWCRTRRWRFAFSSVSAGVFALLSACYLGIAVAVALCGSPAWLVDLAVAMTPCIPASFGLALAGMIFMPCSTACFNDNPVLKTVRNVFFATVGLVCVGAAIAIALHLYL